MALGLLLFVAFDCVVFRSGIYDFVVEPRSSAGWSIWNRHLASRLSRQGAANIALLGDSRLTEGFSERRFNELHVAGRERIINLAIPGSTPRVWNFLLRRIDPQRNKFSRVILPMNSYLDIDELENFSNREHDLGFLAPLVGLDESLELANSFSDPAARKRALWSLLLKSRAYGRDFRDFIANPPGRLWSVFTWYRNREATLYRYEGQKRSLAGIEVRGGNIVGWPEGVPDWAKEALALHIAPSFPDQTGRRTAYRRKWLGGILRRYQGSDTEVVLLRIPAFPLPAPPPPNGVPRSFIEEVLQNGGARVIPEEYFGALEAPEYFADAFHLNDHGRIQFTDMLAAALLGEGSDR